MTVNEKYSIVVLLACATLVLAGCEAQEPGKGSENTATEAPSATTAAAHKGDGSGDGDHAENETAGAAGKFPSGSEREWRGFEKGKCGTRFYTVGADGKRVDLERPERLLQGLETVELTTAEGNVRTGVKPAVLLSAHASESVTFFGCDGETRTLTPADDERHLLLLNGKGLLKLLESHPDAPASTPVKVVEHVEFHAAQ